MGLSCPGGSLVWDSRLPSPHSSPPQPFVEIAVKHHNRYEAKKYAPRVTPEQRVKAFILVGYVGCLGLGGQEETGAMAGAHGSRGIVVQQHSQGCGLGGLGRDKETLILPLPVGAALHPQPCFLPLTLSHCGVGNGAFSPRFAPRDLEQAADAAIEHKNEAEMNLVLSKCSAATDSAVMEKLNRARAQLLKK